MHPQQLNLEPVLPILKMPRKHQLIAGRSSTYWGESWRTSGTYLGESYWLWSPLPLAEIISLCRLKFREEVGGKMCICDTAVLSFCTISYFPCPPRCPRAWPAPWRRVPPKGPSKACLSWTYSEADQISSFNNCYYPVSYYLRTCFCFSLFCFCSCSCSAGRKIIIWKIHFW